MKPYNKEFVLNKMKKYNKLLNESSSGICKIIKDNSEDELSGYMYEKKYKYSMPIIKLYEGNKEIMAINPIEIEGSYGAIQFAHGKVGIVGLGLGYVANEIAEKDNVKEVIVYETSNDIINLYNENFEANPKIKIVYENGFKAKKQVFDFFYVDIYSYELNLKVVEDYIKFNEIHKIDEYSFWGIEHFLLSCKYEDIVWVYIPENWIAMSKKLYEALDSSGYIRDYKYLEENKVKKILLEFKEILNS